MTKSDLIRAEILRRYPCMAMPKGAQIEIAEKYDVSRELVRQIAGKVGAWAVRTGHLPGTVVRLCPVCQKPTEKTSGVCARGTCNKVTLPCGSCGGPVERTTGSLIRSARRAREMGSTATGMVFCSGECRGRYAGTHHGWGARAQWHATIGCARCCSGSHSFCTGRRMFNGQKGGGRTRPCECYENGHSA